VPGDTNNTTDAFVHDRMTGETSRVSVATGGVQAIAGLFDGSREAAISADGRFVAFTSFATNLVAGDTNARSDIFVRDRQTGETSRVSVASDGTQGNAPTPGISSELAALSADGRFVAFRSAATNLVDGDTNGWPDIFVHDRGPLNLAVFGGFEQPVENLPFTNSTQAGRSIAIKWQLTDESGGYVRDLAIVKSLQFATVSCDSQDLAYENPIDAEAAGESGLRYDSADEHFVYSWDTHRSMRDTCAVLIVTLADNQQHFARFMLK
jgi:hypothetical protein